MNASRWKKASKDRLATDLRNVVMDMEQYVRASGDQAGEVYATLQGRLEASLAAARNRLLDAQRQFTEQTRGAARAADAYVRDNAWKSIAFAAVIGFAAGFLLKRR